MRRVEDTGSEGIPACAPRKSLRARRPKLIIKMPSLEQTVEQENEQDRRGEAESDLRVILLENISGLFAIIYPHPAFQNEPDAATDDHRRDEAPDVHAESAGGKHENFEWKRRRQHRREQQRPEVVTVDQVFYTRALSWAEFPKRGLPAFARDEIEEKRGEGRTGYGGYDVDRRHSMIVMRERNHYDVRASRQWDERRIH